MENENTIPPIENLRVEHLRESSQILQECAEAIVKYFNNLEASRREYLPDLQRDDIFRYCNTSLIYNMYVMTVKDYFHDLIDEIKNRFFRQCVECEDYIDREAFYRSTDRGDICQSCLDEVYFQCNRCENYFHGDSDAWCNGDEDQCENCINEEQSTINYRKPQMTCLGTESEGDTLKTSRIWSCEVEHYWNDRKKAVQTYKDMPKEFGIAHDGSLNTRGGGVEIQSCLLRGLESEGIIRNVLSSFREAGHIVDGSCGLHVHIDVNDYLKLENPVEKLRQLIAFQLVFESILHLFVPQGRRLNRYARMIAQDYTLEKLAKVDNVAKLMMFWYKTSTLESAQSCSTSHYQDTRYYGFNMHCLFQGYGNIEIRHHSGTLNAQKVLEWANLHCRIVDWALREKVTMATFTKWAKLPKVLLMEKFFELVALTPESKAYFLSRYEKFGDDISNTEENLDVPEKEMLATGEVRKEMVMNNKLATPKRKRPTFANAWTQETLQRFEPLRFDNANNGGYISANQAADFGIAPSQSIRVNENGTFELVEDTTSNQDASL